MASEDYKQVEAPSCPDTCGHGYIPGIIGSAGHSVPDYPGPTYGPGGGGYPGQASDVCAKSPSKVPSLLDTLRCELRALARKKQDRAASYSREAEVLYEFARVLDS